MSQKNSGIPMSFPYQSYPYKRGDENHLPPFPLEGLPNEQSELPCSQNITLSIPVAASEPYPPIMVEQANLNYARMLYQPLASAKSEMTAIYQYLYQSWILQPRLSSLSQLIKRIASVEMHHLEILGELIVRLGGNPKCRCLEHRGFQSWNGSAPNYSQNIQELLKDNIISEEYACNTYIALSKSIQDSNVSACLARLSEDEQLHVQLFRQELSLLQNPSHPNS